jgi:hypothetical protein
MAMRSTLAAWLLVLTLLPLGLGVSGTWPVVIERVGRLAEVFGTARTVVILLLIAAGLIVMTWKLLVQSLYVGLTGRPWIIRSSGLVVLLFFIFIGPVVQWIADDRRVAARLWNALPGILAGLVAVKVCWVVAVLALYGTLAWLFFVPLMPRYLLGLLAILAIPLARLLAAPLALAWNRHR